jgi:hypothetical protein
VRCNRSKENGDASAESVLIVVVLRNQICDGSEKMVTKKILAEPTHRTIEAEWALIFRQTKQSAIGLIA